MLDSPIVHLRSDDNVAVASADLDAGVTIRLGDREILLAQPVGLGHKVSVEEIARGAPVRKYGQVIGFASQQIPPGSHVHDHNLTADSFERDYAFATEVPPAPIAAEEHTFQGYLRPDGRAGTRNYVAVISTVNCSASTSRYICERFPEEILREYPNIDGILPLTHKTGCGMQYDGGDHEQLNRVLAGHARHPNIGAFLTVGLGCEIAQTSHLFESQNLVQVEGVKGSSVAAAARPASAPIRITIQDSGGIRRTVERGVEALKELLPEADRARRTELPASMLILGTQCGGSDGNSGVTANPALGIASDRLVAQGGTTILGEMPEIYGAEHLLTRRAVSREVGEALIERIRWWEWYTKIFGAEINNNPTPGNKAGGLTTIYEKSLGAIAKAGSTALTAVYRYAEEVKERGFVIMDTPGYDPVSLTGIVAGGANICVFTTGRGSVYGCKPVPCIKVSTNTPLHERMKDDMDLNAGVVLEGKSLEEVAETIYREILAVASGKRTKSEVAGVGEEEFAPWTIGPVL